MLELAGSRLSKTLDQQDSLQDPQRRPSREIWTSKDLSTHYIVYANGKEV
jgi:hypothetical protein